MEIFVIPRKGNHNEGYIIYAPLQNLAFTTNNVGAKIVEKYIEGRELTESEKDSIVALYLSQIEKTSINIPPSNDIDIRNSVVFLLSQMCNLACTYCYAQSARSKTIMSKEIVKIAIDTIFIKSNKKMSFVFIGGGEPLVTWDLLEWSINYIHNKAQECNKEYEVIITTNATLLTDERIAFLQDKVVHLGISFDILPTIQNSQRVFPHSSVSSFELVDAAIHKLDNANIEYTFRSTITKEHVNLMVDMVRYVIANYKNVRKLHFEPVASQDDNDESFYDNFVYSFMEARRLGKQHGIIVHNSLSDSIDTTKSRFCQGEFCVTPTGDIVACHRFSSENESNFNEVNYGVIKEVININDDKKRHVLSVFQFKRDECTSCFAKWHCAGGCAAERLVQTSIQNESKCKFNRELIRELLEERIQS